MLNDFFYMNGYGIYVFTAYTLVFGALFYAWFAAWQRMRTLLKNTKLNLLLMKSCGHNERHP